MGVAFLSYAGPFFTDYQDELVQETWLKQVHMCDIPVYNIIVHRAPQRKMRKRQCTNIFFPQIQELSIPCNPSYSFVMFLSKPTLVRDWNIQGPPSDSFSTENGAIVTKSSRYDRSSNTPSLDQCTICMQM